MKRNRVSNFCGITEKSTAVKRKLVYINLPDKDKDTLTPENFPK